MDHEPGTAMLNSRTPRASGGWQCQQHAQFGPGLPCQDLCGQHSGGSDNLEYYYSTWATPQSAHLIGPARHDLPMPGANQNCLALQAPIEAVEAPSMKRFCPAPGAANPLPAISGSLKSSHDSRGDSTDAVGSRVFARGVDGAITPGKVTAVRYFRGNTVAYCVTFDDGSTREVRARDIIGAGFRQLTHTHLWSGQTVYVTYNRVRCPGRVLEVDERKAQVVVTLESGDSVRCSIDDVQADSHEHTPTHYPGTEHTPTHYPGTEHTPTHYPGTEHTPTHYPGTEHTTMGAYATPQPLPCLSSSDLDPGHQSLSANGSLPRFRLASSTCSRRGSAVSSRGRVSPGLSFPDTYPESSLDSTSTARSAACKLSVGLKPMSDLSLGGANDGGNTRALYRCLYANCTHDLTTLAGMRRHLRQTHMGGSSEVPNSVVDSYIFKLPMSNPTVVQRSTSSLSSGLDRPTAFLDGVKCRKRYGANRKEWWCTKCRWKKACERVPAYKQTL